MNRIMFAGTASSSGKTTISCGFMKALTDRGQKVASFKCGPDYIDPMFHEQIVGTRAGNLDGFFLKNKQLREMLFKNSAGCDITVLEGVMGCYDGIGFTREASGYEVAAATGTPIVLIAGVRGMAASMTAMVRGFIEEDREGLIRGVILNQLPASLYPAAKREIEAIRPGLICYGYVPVNRALELKSRHLGLVTPDEVRDMREKVSLTARQIEETVDVDGLFQLAGEANFNSKGLDEKVMARFRENFREADRGFAQPDTGISNKVRTDTGEADPNFERAAGKTKDGFREVPVEMNHGFEKTNGKIRDGFRETAGEKSAPLRIAIAKDRAFSFLYRDNLNWLTAHGAEPVFFSPLEDEKIPEHCQGLILPGGYPELYLEGLEKNGSMRASVRRAVSDGMPTIAECGGFLYLLDRVEEGVSAAGKSAPRTGEKTQGGAGKPDQTEGKTQEGAGEADQTEEKTHESTEKANQTEKKSRQLAGVIHKTARNSHRLGRFGYIYLTAQTNGLLADAGETIRAHEFHHYTTDDDGHAFRADKASGTGSWETGYHTETLYAGFPHIYFPGNEKAGRRFLEACSKFHSA